MTTLNDFITDTLFLLGLLAATLTLRLIDWYQRTSTEWLVYGVASLFVGLVFIWRLF